MPSDRTNCWRGARRIAVFLPILLSLQPGGAALALAQDAPTSGPDADARALFKQVAEAYKALSSYSDQGQFVVAMTLAGKAHREAQPLRLAFVRPNKIDLDAGSVRVVSDGKTLTTVVRSLKNYTTTLAPATIGMDTFREGPTGALLFGGPTAAPIFVLLNLLTGTSPDVLVEEMGGRIRGAAPSGTQAGAGKPESFAIVIDIPSGPDLVLRVDPVTKLLAAIDLKIESAQPGKNQPPGQRSSIEQFGWTAGNIATRIKSDRSFAFVPPKDFSLAPDLKARPGDAAGGPRFAIEATIGKPAPEFSTTLLDEDDKMRTLTNRDLAGKVVVIDFWASWCGPCVLELPEIQKLVDHYNRANKSVLILALSQDMLPEQIPALRKFIEKTLADKGINLTSGPAGRIGLDPTNAVGRAFNVEGFPSLVILDGKGIVRSAYVGYHSDTDEPLHQSLIKQIDAILAGK